MYKVKKVFNAMLTEGKYVGLNTTYLVLEGEDNTYAFASWFDDCETTEYSLEQLTEKLNGKNLAIIGGEPLADLGNVHKLVLTLRDTYVIIETKATIMPTRELFERVGHWIISPELVSSKKDLDKRINYDVMNAFLDNTKDPFVFRVMNPQDLGEVKFLQDQLKIPSNRIYLMPSEKSYVGMTSKSWKVIDWCKEHGYNFSPRLQVSLYRTLRLFKKYNN